MTFDEVRSEELIVKLLVVGIGGAGGNAIKRMLQDSIAGVDYLAVNTDLQALRHLCEFGASLSKEPRTLQIGKAVTQGLGAGGDPEIGRKAAEESKNEIADELQGYHMVFIAAGLGGGTGTGALPVIAKVTKELGILTVAIVTKPFLFEGKKRAQIADSGLDQIKDTVDALIPIPNQRLLSLVGNDVMVDEAFQKVDTVLSDAVRGIADLITFNGDINLDFSDVKNVIRNSGGNALIGVGTASGDDRAIEAAKNAITNPLLEDVSIEGAKGVLVNVMGGDIRFVEFNSACEFIQNKVGEPMAKTGLIINKDMSEEMKVTVIVSGFQKRKSRTLGKGGYLRFPGEAEMTIDRKPEPVSDATARMELVAEPDEEVSAGQELEEPVGIDPLFTSDFKDIPADDLDVPAFLRRRKAEQK